MRTQRHRQQCRRRGRDRGARGGRARPCAGRCRRSRSTDRRPVRDAALRARLGRAARATAERSFDRTRLAAELVPVYRRAAAEGPAPASRHAAWFQNGRLDDRRTVVDRSSGGPHPAASGRPLSRDELGRRTARRSVLGAHAGGLGWGVLPVPSPRSDHARSLPDWPVRAPGDGPPAADSPPGMVFVDVGANWGISHWLPRIWSAGLVAWSASRSIRAPAEC